MDWTRRITRMQHDSRGMDTKNRSPILIRAERERRHGRLRVFIESGIARCPIEVEGLRENKSLA